MLLRTNLRRDRTQTINRKSQGLHRLDREVAKATPRRITAHAPRDIGQQPPPRADIGQRRRGPHQPAPSLGRRVDDATDKRRTSRHSLPHANNYPQQNPAPAPSTQLQRPKAARGPLSSASHNPPRASPQPHKISRDTTRLLWVSGDALAIISASKLRPPRCTPQQACTCLLFRGLLEPSPDRANQPRPMRRPP